MIELDTKLQILRRDSKVLFPENLFMLHIDFLDET